MIIVDLTTYKGVIQSLNLALADYDIVKQTKTTITFKLKDVEAAQSLVSSCVESAKREVAE